MALFTSNFKNYLFIIFSVAFYYFLIMFGVLFFDNEAFEDPFDEKYRVRYILNSVVNYPKPSVVILGTSRASFSLESQKIASFLGYSPEKGINLATPGLGLISFSKLLDKIDLSSVKEIIICPDEYFFYASEKGSLERYKSDSILAEEEKKIADKGKIYYYWHNKNRIIPNFIDKASWFKKYLQTLIKAYPAPYYDWAYDHNTGRWTCPSIENSNMSPSEFSLTAPERYIELYYTYDRVTFSETKAARFEDFLDKIKDKKITILLLPNYPMYRQKILANPQKASMYNAYVEYINSLGKMRNIKVINLDVNPDLNLQGIDFSDPVHLRFSGAQKLMNYLKTIMS